METTAASHIRERREALGISRIRLAARVGCSLPYLQTIEAGIIPKRGAVLPRIEAVLCGAGARGRARRVMPATFDPASLTAQLAAIYPAKGRGRPRGRPRTTTIAAAIYARELRARGVVGQRLGEAVAGLMERERQS